MGRRGWRGAQEGKGRKAEAGLWCFDCGQTSHTTIPCSVHRTLQAMAQRLGWGEWCPGCGAYGHTLALCPMQDEEEEPLLPRPMPEWEEPEHPQPKQEEPERPTPEWEEPEHPMPEREEPEHPTPEWEEPERPTPEWEEPERPQHEWEEPERPQPKRGESKPSAVCFALGLCTPQQPGKGMQELLTNEISETGYIVSQQALPRATSQLEDTVVQLLEQICSHLPSEVSQECQDFVDKYGKTVIDFLLSSMAPHTICTLLHLCLGVESPVPVISTGSDCEVCDSLVSKVKLSLGTNVTAPEYEAVMDAVCYSYQPAFQECKNFVQSYKPQLLKVLGKPWDSQTTCKEVEACVTVKTVPLLGTKECTWGPSYWCTDMQTAKECNVSTDTKRILI
ncbi:UNVERIFIED_CONTAM: hypothetical protein FKN15_015428 [Acipenser sinensis]